MCVGGEAALPGGHAAVGGAGAGWRSALHTVDPLYRSLGVRREEFDGVAGGWEDGHLTKPGFDVRPLLGSRGRSGLIADRARQAIFPALHRVGPK